MRRGMRLAPRGDGVPIATCTTTVATGRPGGDRAAAHCAHGRSTMSSSGPQFLRPGSGCSRRWPAAQRRRVGQQRRRRPLGSKYTWAISARSAGSFERARGRCPPSRGVPPSRLPPDVEPGRAARLVRSPAPARPAPARCVSVPPILRTAADVTNTPIYRRERLRGPQDGSVAEARRCGSERDCSTRGYFSEPKIAPRRRTN